MDLKDSVRDKDRFEVFMQEMFGECNVFYYEPADSWWLYWEKYTVENNPDEKTVEIHFDIGASSGAWEYNYTEVLTYEEFRVFVLNKKFEEEGRTMEGLIESVLWSVHIDRC